MCRKGAKEIQTWPIGFKFSVSSSDAKLLTWMAQLYHAATTTPPHHNALIQAAKPCFPYPASGSLQHIASVSKKQSHARLIDNGSSAASHTLPRTNTNPSIGEALDSPADTNVTDTPPESLNSWLDGSMLATKR
jgi:hypothetical protein